MAVSNYSGSTGGCKYSYNKLKDVLYLVSAEHVKDVQIDNGEAFISGLTEIPLKIDGFNIQFKEETALDERYKFQKTLTLSMNGYVNYKIFGGKYYAIIESQDGTLFMINVDFPSRITHTYNLSNGSNQTDFTFSSVSNFPTLKLNSEFDSTVSVCTGFKVQGGISKLELIERERAKLDNENKVVISTDDFKYVDFLGKSCTFQEIYDGYKVTDTITFDIALDNYKPSWQYNLLEFLNNKYSAIIEQKGVDKKYYIGFNYGLQPSYAIQTASQNGQSDTITVSLTEISIYGAENADDWGGEFSGQTEWMFVKQVDCIFGYECVELGIAKYLLKEEVDIFGNPTGNYKALEGYEEQFPTLNIVGTFSDEVFFANNDCNDGEICETTTDMPNTVEFTSAGCQTYSLKASCDWSVSDLPSNITVSPTSGVANSAYTINVCNSTEPTSTNSVENYFMFNCCDGKKVINCIVYPESNCIRPLMHYITCLGQTVVFTYDGDCLLNVVSASSGITYTVQNNLLVVQVPENTTTSVMTFTLTVTNCGCGLESTTLSIIQDKVYEQWITEDGYLCVSGDSYTVERKYTGTTSGSIITRTEETRPGTLIKEDDERCSLVVTKYEWDGQYICIGNNKYKSLEEYISYDGGTTWEKTGRTQPGELVESASTYCESAVTYSWVITTQYMCSGKTSYYLYQKYQSIEGSTPTPVYPNVYSVDGEGTMPLVKRMDNDPDCGYSPTGVTLYRWTNIDISEDYYCEECPYYTQYLTFVAIDDCVFSYSDTKQYSTIKYSVDNGITWHGIEYPNYSLTTPTVKTGGKVLWKGFYNNTEVTRHFWSSGRFNVEGNIMSIAYGDNFSDVLVLSRDIISLFAYCDNLISAENLQLPAIRLLGSSYKYLFKGCEDLTTPPSKLPALSLWDSCYEGMFWGCVSLETLPSDFLPATSFNVPGEEYTLATGCYSHMFEDCTSLTTVPILPATAVTSTCYHRMFKGCTSLTTVPSNIIHAASLDYYACEGMFQDCTGLTTMPLLSATTLEGRCYQHMFSGCTSLTTVYQLPATTLYYACYEEMFGGCTSLRTVPSNMLPATNLSGATECYYGMFEGCTSLTTAPNLPATTLAESCYDTMFWGCTSLTTAPNLPATNLANSYSSCYCEMFWGCTSLTTPPIISASRLSPNCFNGMFKDCTALTTVPILSASTLDDYCYAYMFSGCTSLTTVPSNLLPATTLEEGCYKGMFGGCTNLTTLPSLPATSTDELCYSYMFSGCTSLATAQSNLLPATTLEEGCYEGMFGGCTSLTTVPNLPATTLASDCYNSMFFSCTSLENAPVLPATTLIDGCYYNMFKFCTSLNNITCLATDISAAYCTTDWVYDVASSGTFTKASSMDDWAIGRNGIPSGWTILPPSEPLIFCYSNIVTITSTPNINIYYRINVSGSYSAYTTPISITADTVVQAYSEKNGLSSNTVSQNCQYIDPLEQPLTFVAIESGTFKFIGNSINYSLDDGNTWTNLESDTNSPTVSAGNKIMWKATLTPEQYYGIGTFSSTANFAVEGNAMSLLYGDNFSGQTSLSGKNYAFYSLFEDCNGLMSAENLVLPATTLASNCYNYMFYGCTSLTTTSELPATTLNDRCYEGMFYGCTSLTTAPSLPATALANGCYSRMFQGCTSLTTAPELPATTLEVGCYYCMFYGCTSLNNITCLATNISANECTDYWVIAVAASGTFTKAASMNSWIIGINGIPSGWTVTNA